MSVKDGKKPLSKKPAPAMINADQVFGNPLQIPKDLQDELDSQNLVARWISADVVYKGGGYHPKRWSPYKRKNVTQSMTEFGLGRDPEGVIRRGDLILGVKTKDAAELQKAYLNQKADRATGINQEKADEMRRFARDSNINATIHEGYDDNE